MRWRAWLAPPPRALLYSTFQNHAVLQREAPIPRLGNDDGRRHRNRDTRKGYRSSFFHDLPSHGAGGTRRSLARNKFYLNGGPYTLTAASSSRAREKASDILIGHVFLCSGQSNMEYPMRLASDYDQDVNNADNSLIRLFHVDRFRSAGAGTTFGAGTRREVTSPDSVREFAAACYFFGRDLQPAVAVPIGLIESGMGRLGDPGVDQRAAAPPARRLLSLPRSASGARTIAR